MADPFPLLVDFLSIFPLSLEHFSQFQVLRVCSSSFLHHDCFQYLLSCSPPFLLLPLHHLFELMQNLLHSNFWQMNYHYCWSKQQYVELHWHPLVLLLSSSHFLLLPLHHLPKLMQHMLHWLHYRSINNLIEEKQHEKFFMICLSHYRLIELRTMFFPSSSW